MGVQVSRKVRCKCLAKGHGGRLSGHEVYCPVDKEAWHNYEKMLLNWQEQDGKPRMDKVLQMIIANEARSKHVDRGIPSAQW